MPDHLPHNHPDAPPEFTDRIVLRLATDQAAGQRVCIWAGAWPPPGRLLLVREQATDRYKLINPADYPADTPWHRMPAESACDVYEFKLHRASEIEHRARPDEQWFRGAEYLPTGVRYE